jgi:hypothetical protein
MKSLSLIFIFFSFNFCAIQPLLSETQTSSGFDTGKKEADKYFKSRNVAATDSNGTARYLAIQGGMFTQQDTYNWGKSGKDEVGETLFGVTYRIGEWSESMDFSIRADILNFDIDNRNISKLSLLPLITFPDARSGFPLYFGAGLGLGVFFKQLEGESAITLDSQLLAGARFLNLLGSMGFILELGLKNQFFLLSDGQQNSVYVSSGAVFAF